MDIVEQLDSSKDKSRRSPAFLVDHFSKDQIRNLNTNET